MTPTERKQRIESYSNAYQTLVETIRQFPREMWRYRAAHDPWTIHEILVHIADSEANSFIRARRAIAEPGSAVLGYDELAWARNLRYEEQSADDALKLFKWLRGNTYKLIDPTGAGTNPSAVRHAAHVFTYGRRNGWPLARMGNAL